MEEAERQQLAEELKNLDAQIEMTEQRRQTATPEFIALLRRKLEICTLLNKQKDVTNCEARIRFIEARMRGESLPHTDIIEMDRFKRRKRRNKSNTLLLTFVALFMICAMSLPMLKHIVDTKVAEREALDDVETASSTTGTTGGATVTADAKEGQVVDVNNGGHMLVMPEFLKTGRKSIFFFHSDYCGPCEAAIPAFGDTALKYPEMRFYLVNIDRPGSRGIDWDSPIAHQFNLHSIPYFVIYDGHTKVAEGNEARQQLEEMSGNR